MNLLLAINIPCWLIPILVGLISAILGYLLGRLLGGSNKLEVDEDVYKNRISKLEADLEACKSGKSSFDADKSKLESALADCKSSRTRLEAELLTAKNSLSKASDASSSGITSSLAAPSTPTTPVTPVAAAAAPTGAAFDSDAAKLVFGKKIKEDDLTVVEGIGPKIRELFHNHDIKTWAALGNTSVDKCQEVLNSGGKRFDIHKPGTWPRQSKLASEGKWQELKDWQDSLDGGK